MAKKVKEIDLNIKRSDNDFFIISYNEYKEDTDGYNMLSDRKVEVSETFVDMMIIVESLAKGTFGGD